MTKLKKSSKPQPVCIFCGGKPVTKEHFWPKWADALLPKPAPHQHVEVLHTFTEIIKLKGTKKRTKPGNAQTKKIRAVCAPCNNGWMSALEEQAIPILTSLITGRDSTMAPEAQTIIARWIAMKVMVAEYNHPSDAVTLYADREQFRLTAQMPPSFQIMIARCGVGGWETGYRREAATASLTPTPNPADVAGKNIQEIAFGIGDLFVHVVSSTVPGFDPGIDILNPDAVIRLWPPTGQPIVWPPKIRLSVTDAFTVGTVLGRMFRGPRVRWLAGPGK